jgi:hypothetical protein
MGLSPPAERTFIAGIVMDLARQSQINTANIAALTANMESLTRIVNTLVDKDDQGREQGVALRREVDTQIQEIAAHVEAQNAVSNFKWKLAASVGTLFGIAGVIAAVYETVCRVGL